MDAGLEIYGVPVFRWSEQTFFPDPAPAPERINITIQGASLTMAQAAARAAALAIVKNAATERSSARTERGWRGAVGVLGVLGCLFFAITQAYGVISDLWWGATGGDLRAELGTAMAFLQTTLVLWYVRLAMRAWRWWRG